MRIAGLAVVAGMVWLPTARGHYHMLLPDKPSVKRGEAVTFTYQFGHPFEHQLFDTQPPRELFVITPGGAKRDLLKTLEKTAADGADGKKVAAFRFAFTPEDRGDYLFVAKSPAFHLEDDKRPHEDMVKVFVHVQTQNGWEHKFGEFAELVLEDSTLVLEVSPLTRPYGLQPGMVFRLEVEESRNDLGVIIIRPASGDIQPDRSRPLSGAMVEVERYNPTPPKELPPDEHITRVVRTDRVGTATATLTDPGWWSLTASREVKGTLHRCTFWVFVDDKVPLQPAK
jgi:uncharacterized GH25 family protein